MDWVSQITTFDVIVLVIFFVFIIRGIWLGFFRQLSLFIALFAGYAVVGQMRENFFQLILPFVRNSAVAFLATYLCIMLVIYFVSFILGKVLQKVVSITMMEWFDRSMGGLFGFLKAFFLANLLFMVMAAFLSGGNTFLRNAATYPFFKVTSEYLLTAVKDGGIREKFLPKVPAIQLEKVPVLKPGEKEPAPEPAEEGGKESTMKSNSRMDEKGVPVETVNGIRL